MLREEPYSKAEADAAAGLGTSSFYEALEQRKYEQKMLEQERKMEIEA